MLRGKCALGRGLGLSPKESVSVLLSKHIHLSVARTFSMPLFEIAIGKTLGGGELECLGEKLPFQSIEPCKLLIPAGRSNRKWAHHVPATTDTLIYSCAVTYLEKFVMYCQGGAFLEIT